MRVGLDVRLASHGVTSGLRTYVLNLARELPLAAQDIEFLYYADAKAPLELEHLPGNVQVRTLPWSSPLSTLVNDLRFAARVADDRLDLAHFPANYGLFGSVPVVVTLHDALTLFPLRDQWRGLTGGLRARAMTTYTAVRARHSATRARRLIAPSEHARRDIAERTGVPLDRIDRILHAADPLFRVIEDRAALAEYRRRHGLAPLVVVADAIKNAPAVLRAHAALRPGLRERVTVALFSRESAPRPDVARLMTGQVRFFTRPSTEELVLLFNIADAFVYPSWFEGFGLPLVEAMQCGAPVIGARRGSIPEIVGTAGPLFDVHDAEALTAHLALLLESTAVRDARRRQSLERARAFSWAETAAQTVSSYRHALEGGH
jgi:glycosyltransferase involved in cell wall biosynthesis